MKHEDEIITGVFRESHAGDPIIPFSRLLARARSKRHDSRPSFVPRVAAAACAAVVLAVATAVLRAPAPQTHIAGPLHGWHAPTDFLLADTRPGPSTDFLLRNPKDSPKGAPR